VSEREAEGFYAALLADDPEGLYERAPCGYLSTTPDGLIVKANQTFLNLSGYAREDLVRRRHFVDLLTAGGRIYHETHYAPLLRMQGRVREIALELVTASGGRLPVLVNSVLERSPGGAAVVVRTAVFDATERRAYEQELLRAKQRAEASEARATALARTLQQTLMPPSAPRVPGLDLAAGYRPAGDGAEVGGDFYDVFEIGSGDWVVAVGDVRGKGVEAAVVTAMARFTLRGAAVRLPTPAAALGALNQALLRHGSDRFCTVCLVRLRQSGAGWSVTFSSGGHPLPLLLRRGGPAVECGEPGTLLGLFEDPVLRDTSVSLCPGDMLLLYTDGAVEGRDGREFFGEERLAAAAARYAGSAGALVYGVLASVLDFQVGEPRDDIAMVAIRVPD
jgi:phosphoserine phosphatase RsbU/P